MKLVAMILASAGAASALVTRAPACCFHLNASGGPGGPVGQLDDGQNRIGQKGLPGGQYCIDGNGGLTDSHGRGCILTPPTTQWQCDAGAKPTVGFSLSAAGSLLYKSSSKFFVCPTGDHGGYNIYSTTLPGEPGCVSITLTADRCAPSTSGGSPPSPNSGSPSSPPIKGSPPQPSSPGGAPSSPVHGSPSQPSVHLGTPPSGPAGTCPLALPSNYQFPHLIIPVNSNQAHKSYGTSFNGTASATMSSIFDFDIPMSMAGEQCALEFALPTQDELETSMYSMSGDGRFEFFMLAAAATEETTYANMASKKTSLGVFEFQAGHVNLINKFKCPAGQVIGFLMTAYTGSQINYFQDSNPCPIGLYITSA